MGILGGAVWIAASQKACAKAGLIDKFPVDNGDRTRDPPLDLEDRPDCCERELIIDLGREGRRVVPEPAEADLRIPFFPTRGLPFWKVTERREGALDADIEGVMEPLNERTDIANETDNIYDI